jgi:type IV pilus assembly protein PilF
MKKLACALVCWAIVGCAQEPVQPPLTQKQPTSPEHVDARSRADVHAQLGAAYYEIGSYAVALDELNEALRADADYGPAYNILGLVYMGLGEDARAEQSFRRALSINAQDSDAHNNYGWFLCQRKRNEEGIKHFMAALKNPLYASPEKSYINAGICARGRGDDKVAAEYFERALQAQPQQPQALYQLADLAFRRNALPEARMFLTRLSRTGTAFNAEALWLAVRVERALGDKDAEASYGMQLRRNYPNSRETQALLNRQFE